MKILKLRKGSYIIIFFIILSLLDLIFPSKGDNVDRMLPQVGRAIFLGVMLITIFSVKMSSNIKIPSSLTGRGVNFLLFLFFYIGLFSPKLFFVNFTSMVKILYWYCGYFFFYYLLVKGVISSKHIKYFAIAAVIIYFFTVLRDLGNIDLRIGSKEFFVSNNAYHLLKLFPLVLLFQKNILKNLLIALIAIGIVLSFKRGALLALSVSLLIYYSYILFKEKKNKLSKLILGTVIIGVGYFYFIQNISVFLSRFEDLNSIDTAGSGRGRMFKLLVEDMILDNFQLLKFTFGNGVFATKDFFFKTINHRIVAHSDFMEFFYDFGLLGVFGVLYFFNRVYKLYKFFKEDYYGMVLKIWLISIGLSSLYSINLFAAEMIYAVLPIVFLEFERLKRLRSQNINTLNI